MILHVRARLAQSIHDPDSVASDGGNSGVPYLSLGQG